MDGLDLRFKIFSGISCPFNPLYIWPQDENGKDFLVEKVLPSDVCISCTSGTSGSEDDATILYDWKQSRDKPQPVVCMSIDQR